MTLLALTGGVGGAKLALGLSKILNKDEVVFLVNTGDDFVHMGLHISPDVDTLIYTLAGKADPIQGWGRQAESWNFLETLEELLGETWFRLGDKDLAVHVLRTLLLNKGWTLTRSISRIAKALGVVHKVLPVTNDELQTMVITDRGRMPFQHYFVKHQCEPTVHDIEFSGATTAKLNPQLDLNQITAVVICPSNPYLSVDPLLAIDELKSFLANSSLPRVAVSPIVQGSALKGPTAQIMNSLGHPVSSITVSKHYQELINGIIIDHSDEMLKAEIKEMDLHCTTQQTVMKTLEDKIKLAQEVMSFCGELSQ